MGISALTCSTPRLFFTRAARPSKEAETLPANFAERLEKTSREVEKPFERYN